MLVATVTLAALAASPAAAAPPKSDRQADRSGDVVRTYADGHATTGYGKSDIHSVRLALGKSRGGASKGITVTAFLDKLTPNMIRRHLHLRVRFVTDTVTDTGHVGKTVTTFRGNITITRMQGFPADECVPYPGLSYRRETLSIGLSTTATAGLGQRRSGQGPASSTTSLLRDARATSARGSARSPCQWSRPNDVRLVYDRSTVEAL
jgi:hypothetical protein